MLTPKDLKYVRRFQYILVSIIYYGGSVMQLLTLLLFSGKEKYDYEPGNATSKKQY
ncbi:hypothetical protein SAMN05192534_1027 [Alteribacillus persepolensis]|uniref:Uncharacterized protein n=1 Tax=Alteribacillus persepolensis TaxID=568899 RepID=A0A1G8A3D8_9BACI|nr:hypothetical protein SAMN05192534_1027 [Alteribacillus persepolensis]